MGYERSNIAAMSGYTPGEQPAEASAIKLNTNENPYPPPPAVLEVLRGLEAEALRRYPSPAADAFRQAAADLHGLDPANVIATNGGDELLRLAITTFVEPGQAIATLDPGYSLLPVLGAIHASPLVALPLEKAWSLPADLAERANAAGAALTVVVNPHAPSGTLTPVARLEEIAGKLEGVLLVDEAYVDFADPALEHDAIPLVKRFDNVLILRSLSKGYSLAGLRFGYGLGAPTLIRPMGQKTKDSYNVDAVAQAVALEALRQRDAAQETWSAVRGERERMAQALGELGLACPPSQSNFLLAGVPRGQGGGAAAVCRTLKERGILVRWFDAPRLEDKLRITVGTPEQNDALLAALGEIVK